MKFVPERWSFQSFKHAVSEPSKFIEEINRVNETLVQRAKTWPHRNVEKHIFHKNHGTGIDVVTKDWDNLIILDACRYDIFKQQNNINGHLSSVISKASHSDEFVIGNFNGKTLHDTLYVSANTKAETDLKSDVFYKVSKTYSDTRFEKSYDNWRPEVVKKTAINEYKNHKNKRFIIHFMQPHAPYIGPKAAKIKDDLYNSEKIGFIVFDNDKNKKADRVFKNLIVAADRGYISDKQLLEVYVENLNIVLEHIRDMLSVFDGKTVVTSDHGELLGDPSNKLPISDIYSHPRKTYVPELRLVPWLEIESNNRRKIISEEPEVGEKVSGSSLDCQLEALGYK